MKNLHVIPTDKPSYLYKMSDGSFHISDLFEGGNSAWKNQNIYITSDEEIKEGDGVILISGRLVKAEVRNGQLGFQSIDSIAFLPFKNDDKKIILSTDQDLINDGVQSIDDEFLEWFVKNPSCENVEVKPLLSNNGRALFGYKIIIPKEEQCTCKEHDPYCCQIHGNCPTCVKEEPIHLLSCCKSLEECHCGKYTKQETLEEAAERLYPTTIDSFTDTGIDISATERIIFIEGAKWQQQQENTANDILNYILTNDDGVGIALGYNSREMIEQHFKNIGYDR
ncbi:hypothetical protein UFOVP1247_94 [uncultured Caudovirales phage]|uniref:Uncharacterized protein n=1 Tax=uncultured Caudovirales phage TaxID=2100421 RepID=A0A6J5R956_9CAUD|nr:hypothetical protein UFOVP970_134 [uncultured Caudovirales phage]CAB4193533.1 hypothetical protein UFOVP1247_94 [uncultured Caudovirales phage]